MADANKRINLAAPLLSVRRHGGGAAADATGTPAYAKPDAAPGGVPFRWEHRPGHPKSVRTRRTPPPPPPRPTAPDEAVQGARDTAPLLEEAKRFSDALSRVDSCFTVNCSATGLSDAGAPSRAPSARGSVMMDRFLLAAKAAAVDARHCAIRNAGAAARTSPQEPARPPPVNDSDRLPRRLPVEQLPPANHVVSIYTKNVNEDDDWDAHSTADFAPKRCWLLPTRCVKSTLLFLNPAQAMRRVGGVRRAFLSKGGRAQNETKSLLRRSPSGHRPGHEATTQQQQSWEEVYINSLLRSDRACLKPGAVASELNKEVHQLYANQGGNVHPKATHLGLLLVLDKSDEYLDYHHCSSAQSLPKADGKPALPLPPKSSRPAAKANRGKKFPPLMELLEDEVVTSRDIVPWTESLLALPSPKTPSESWLSRALPSVSGKPPAASFMGIHAQPRKQTPPPWCSSDEANVVNDARPRQIRI